MFWYTPYIGVMIQRHAHTRSRNCRWGKYLVIVGVLINWDKVVVHPTFFTKKRKALWIRNFQLDQIFFSRLTGSYTISSDFRDVEQVFNTCPTRNSSRVPLCHQQLNTNAHPPLALTPLATKSPLTKVCSTPYFFLKWQTLDI